MMAIYLGIVVALFAYEVAAGASNARFYISDDKMPYFTAVHICQSLNMRLLRPESGLDTVFTSTVFPEAVDFALNEADEFGEMRMQFWYLTSPEPGPQSLCNQISVLYSNGERTLQTDQDLCLEPKQFICERPGLSRALVSNFAVSSELPLSFMEAAKACGVHNSYLAYVRSELENRELTQQIKSTTDAQKRLFWLGGVHIKSNRDFRWFPSNKYLVYANWKHNRTPPKGAGCIAMAFGQADVSSPWVGLPCNTELPFVCRSAPPKKTSLQVWIPNPEKTSDAMRALLGAETQNWLRQTIHGLFHGSS
ncbi:uncharacterized protein LOC109543574 [Dendroctonus ponderosae]|uniref:C-type lectin domain-containing protein n=1 Tax=Dendroctonus ponderosae TaxID=77166 RepID=U4UBS6_DENPD|nr:uncharacterized protein LOC109543574 [Dendroctonus ponderosae]ERL91364.1 hypothetical protein D910_08696 [Dendroctonus ponderosae]